MKDMTSYLPPFEKRAGLDHAILTNSVVASSSHIQETLEPLGLGWSSRSRNVSIILNVNGEGEVTAVRLAMSGKPFARKLDAKRLFTGAPEGSKLTIKHLDVVGLEFPPGEKTSLWVSSTNFDWAINPTNNRDQGSLTEGEMLAAGIGEWSIRVHVEFNKDPIIATLKWVAILKPVEDLSSLPGNAAKPGYPTVAISDGEALMSGVANPPQLVGVPWYPVLINDAAPDSEIHLPEDTPIIGAMTKFCSEGNVIRNLTVANWTEVTRGPGEPSCDHGIAAWAWTLPAIAAPSDHSDEGGSSSSKTSEARIKCKCFQNFREALLFSLTKPDRMLLGGS